MKNTIYALVAALSLAQINAIALPDQASDFHVVQDSPIGPIYSNKSPNTRRSEANYYVVGGDADHPVYSSVAPSQAAKVENRQVTTNKRASEPQDMVVEKREISQADVDSWVKSNPESETSAEAMNDFITKHPDAMKKLQQRDLNVTMEQDSEGIEKRDWALCTACHGVCLLAYAVNQPITWIQILTQCAALCSAQHACTATENLAYYRQHEHDRN